MPVCVLCINKWVMVYRHFCLYVCVNMDMHVPQCGGQKAPSDSVFEAHDVFC